MSDSAINDFNRDLSQLNTRLRKRSTEVQGRLIQALNEVVAHAAFRIQVNAPILEGDLRASVAYINAYSFIGNVATAKLVAGNGVGYFWTQHELLTPAGTWQLGKVSEQQPMQPEGGVGGDFVTRVLEYHAERYRDHLNAAAKGQQHSFRIEIQ